MLALCRDTGPPEVMEDGLKEGTLELILVSLLDWSLLVCRYATNFCALVLYPATQWAHWLVLVIFSGFLGMFCIHGHLICKVDLLPFPSGHFFFFCLTEPARPSRTMLSGSEEREHRPRPWPGLGQSVQSSPRRVGEPWAFPSCPLPGRGSFPLP